MSSGLSYWSFGCHLIGNDRYLLLIGGRTQEANSFVTNTSISDLIDKLVYFDFKLNKWTVSNYVLPKSVASVKSVMVDQWKLHIFGKMQSTFTDGFVHWSIHLAQLFEWQIRRVVWIGFYKNGIDWNNRINDSIDDNNDNTNNQETFCLFAKIPKDIVHYVFSFLYLKCDEKVTVEK